MVHVDTRKTTGHLQQLTSGNKDMKSCALAILAARMICSRDTGSRLPKAMFSAMVSWNKMGSWLTIPIWLRSHLTFKSLRAWPSRVICKQNIGNE